MVLVIGGLNWGAVGLTGSDLVGALLALPIGFVWSAGERTRSGTAVLLIAVLLVPFLSLRLHDLWTVR